MELYSEAIEILDAGQSPRLLAELLGNRCLCQMRLKRYQEALSDAQRAVQVDASYTKGFYRLAICQKELSDLAGAWESAMRAWALDPQDSAIRELQDTIHRLEGGAER